MILEKVFNPDFFVHSITSYHDEDSGANNNVVNRNNVFSSILQFDGKVKPERMSTINTSKETNNKEPILPSLQYLETNPLVTGKYISKEATEKVTGEIISSESPDGSLLPKFLIITHKLNPIPIEEFIESLCGCVKRMYDIQKEQFHNLKQNIPHYHVIDGFTIEGVMALSEDRQSSIFVPFVGHRIHFNEDMFFRLVDDIFYKHPGPLYGYGKNILISDIKEGDVLSHGYSYSFLFIREETFYQLNITSFKEFITSNQTLTWGIESTLVPYWKGILEFYSIDTFKWESFEYYYTFCAPNNPFHKYDILFTHEYVFFATHFYSVKFLPVKALPFSLSTPEPFPKLFSYSSAADKQQDYMTTNIYMYFKYGNLSEEDISFIKFYSGIENFQIDYNSFKRMIENASAYYQIDFATINATIDDYINNSKVFNFIPTFYERDYWNIPTLVLLISYFLILFISRLFMKPAMKIRLIIPYFPIFIIIQEMSNSGYASNYCPIVVSYVKTFIFCFVCFCYGFTVIRIYYLRNIYSIMYNNQNLDETRNKRMKFMATKKFALIVIPIGSFILSFLLTLQFIAVFFDISIDATLLLSNVSFPIYPLIGALIGCCAILFDIKVNWRSIREKGLKKFLLFDDPFNVRIDLMLMSLLLVLVLVIVVLFSLSISGHITGVLNWLAYLVFILICGGSLFVKELIIAIRKDRSPKSELETLLQNHSFRELFKEYSTKEMSLENFMFYETLRNLISKHGMNGIIPFETLQEMESLFFAKESPYELNIPSRTRKLFYALFENSGKPSDSSSAELMDYGSQTKVSDIHTIIYNDLFTNMSDTHSRFLETDVFKNWYSTFTIQRKQSVIVL